jgi:RYK receptor-like tyrosine kinase
VIATWLRSTAAAKPPAGATPEPPACTTALCTTAELTQNNHSEVHNPSSGDQGSPRAASLPAEEVQGLVVARSALTLGDLLLEGTFGRVYQGRLVTASPAGPVDVMVKTVVTGSSRAQAEKLVTEGSLLYPAAGRGVLAILATTSDGTSPIMIYEYLYPGNLKRWLATCHQPVSTHQAVSLGLQLLSALQHVHRAGLLHRDVAARNCYISSASTSTSLAVKLCDSALSRDLFPGDYHCLGDNDNRPVKWMALDSLQSGHFTASSDVWAWGVVMWEILTRAQQPFPDIDPGEMESYLAEGFRLHQPVNCPDQLYTVMVSCWSHRPHHRAGLPALYTHLKQFNTQLQQFV